MINLPKMPAVARSNVSLTVHFTVYMCTPVLMAKTPQPHGLSAPLNPSVNRFVFGGQCKPLFLNTQDEQCQGFVPAHVTMEFELTLDWKIFVVLIWLYNFAGFKWGSIFADVLIIVHS